MLKNEQILNLIESMSLKEKIGQVNQPHYGWTVWFKKNDKYYLTEEFKSFIKEFGGVGSIYGLLRTDPWTKINFSNGFKDGEQSKIVNLVQKYIKDNTKLKIPALIAEECPHGHQSLFSESYPTNISIGSSFDTISYKRVIEEQRKSLEGKNVNLALISGLDIPMDKRWGRTEECFSEDPFIAYKFNKTLVKEMQLKNTVGVTIKHFIAYGASLDGKNGLNANIGKRELEEIHMKPFFGALEEDVKSIMVAYNEIDGVPCISNEWLLKDILRNKLNYEGLIMADGLAIDGLQTKWINDKHFVAAAALNAGIDISLWDKTFLDLDVCLEKNMIKIETINDAVYRVLKLKNDLGLFECKTESTKKYKEDININIEMAAAGAVILKNHGDLLPFKKELKKVLIIGDDVDDIYYSLGDYSSFRKNDYSTYKNGIDAIAKKLNWDICYEKYNFKTDSSKFDLTIFFAGGNSKRDFTSVFDLNGAIKSSKQKSMTSGEGVDLHSLELPKIQLDSFKKVNSSKILTILNMGKPMVITPLVKKSTAILNMWYPGNRSGMALLKILIGELEPSGKLSHTFPRYSGLNNLRYNDKNISNYKYFDLPKSEVLFDFGFGLGYGKPFSINHMDTLFLDGLLNISIELTNNNNFTRAEPILFFKKVNNSMFTQRKEELIYFEKIKLKGNETKMISIKIDIQDINLLKLNENKDEKFINTSYYLKQNNNEINLINIKL